MRISWTERMTNLDSGSATESRNKAFSSKSHSKKAVGISGTCIAKRRARTSECDRKNSGKQSKGRQRLTYIASISRWTNVAKQELLKTTKDRKK